MEQLLDKTLKERQDLQHEWDQLPDQSSSEGDRVMDALIHNEGETKGMLKMLAIMRSTSMKVELTRARARLQHGD